MPDKNWQFELEEYIKQGEPDRVEKSEAWQTAIGLQAVDGLNTSEYLLDTAKEHIEGKITIDEAQKRIHSYYEQRSVRTETENETKEADIVSARITKLLGEKAFQFSPAEWITVHRRLFEGVFDHAGQIRQYNITKKEWVLNGDTVIYADWNSIKETLDYDFATENQFSYEGLSVPLFHIPSQQTHQPLPDFRQGGMPEPVLPLSPQKPQFSLPLSSYPVSSRCDHPVLSAKYGLFGPAVSNKHGGEHVRLVIF